MKNNFYKIGFFTLLSILFLGVFYIQYTSQSGSNYSPNNSGNSKTDSAMVRPEEVAIQNLIDSVQIVKDSINVVENFMIDSIDLRNISLEQRNAYHETIFLLDRTKLHLDFKLDAARLQLIKSETSDLQSVITKYDRKKDKIDVLSHKLNHLTSVINATVDVISSAVSKGIIVPPKSNT